MSEELGKVSTEALEQELASRVDFRCNACCGKWRAFFWKGTKYCFGCNKPESDCMCGGYYNKNRGYRR